MPEDENQEQNQEELEEQEQEQEETQDSPDWLNEWKPGDIITANKLNTIEGKVAEAYAGVRVVYGGTNASGLVPGFATTHAQNIDRQQDSYLCADGIWKIPPNDNDNDKIEIGSITSSAYIIGASTTSGTTTGKINLNITIDQNGKIMADSFEGDGSQLTNLQINAIKNGENAITISNSAIINPTFLPLATSSSAGIVKSSNSNGKISIDDYGIMSVVGTLLPEITIDDDEKFLKVEKGATPGTVEWKLKPIEWANQRSY